MTSRDTAGALVSEHQASTPLPRRAHDGLGSSLDAYKCVSGATSIDVGQNAEMRPVEGLKNICGALDKALSPLAKLGSA